MVKSEIDKTIFTGNNKEILFVLNGVSWKVLMLLNCVNSLSGRGIFIDAEESGRTCVELPIHYFQKLLKFHENKTDEKSYKADEKSDVVVSTQL